MGGKSYFCDYCQCFMKNDRNVRKVHNDGLQHKIIKTSIMKRYEDPQKLYQEEINKQPCFRYFKGYCKYDLFCQFTHFNEMQLKELRKVAQHLNTKSKIIQSKKINFILKSEESFKLPWKNTTPKRILKMLPLKLPPSLRPLNLRKLSKFDTKINKWGC